MTRGHALIACALLVLGGCGEDADDDPAVTTALAPGTTSTTTSPAKHVGDTIALGDGAITIRLHAVEVPARPDHEVFLEPDAGQQFSAVDVEFCASTRMQETITVSEEMFSLETEDHRRWPFWNVQAFVRSPRLGFPSLAPGQCARGWVSFQTPAGAPVISVHWTDSGGATTDEWLVR